MSEGLNADILLAYVGIITTATISVYAGSHGSLPVSLSFVTVSLFNWSTSFGVVLRSRRVTQSARAMATTRMIPTFS
jgi:hypothetical protein